MQQKIGIYPDRLGVIIGRNGSVKKKIEELTGVKLRIDSKNNVVTVEGEDINSVLTALNIIKAINYGFSPDKAFKLLDPDYTLHIIDIYTYLPRRNENDLKRVLGRIIGEKGKTKRIIEETTDTDISVYRNYVAVIGLFDDILTVDEAIRMLIKGAMHRTVYNFLFASRKMKKAGLVEWY